MAPSLQSLEAKLDMVLRKMDEFSALQAKVIQLETSVSKLESSVDSLNQEVLTLKEKENTREQAERGNTTRLFGLSMGQDEGTGPDFGPALAKRVYDSIIKPVLASAKLNKHLETLPSLPNAIREVYRIKPSNKLPTGNQSPPPPVIIKFASSAVKSAFFRNKRASLPTPSADEKAAGTKHYSVVEDLTVVTYKLLREMNDCAEVDKVWSVEGRLRFTLVGDSNKIVKKVSSVFKPVTEIIRG